MQAPEEQNCVILVHLKILVDEITGVINSSQDPNTKIIGLLSFFIPRRMKTSHSLTECSLKTGTV